jgi:hypothetical protein
MNRRPVHRIETIPMSGTTQVPVGLGKATRDPDSSPQSISRPQPGPEREGSTSDAPVQRIMWEQLVAQNAATHQLLSGHERLVDLIERMSRPAQMDCIVLTPAQPTVESREKSGETVLSIGILNPNNINIYFSGTGTASAITRSPAAPPTSLIVLPIMAQMIEIAANPTDLGANTAICFLFRFFTVQPAFLGVG